MSSSFRVLIVTSDERLMSREVFHKKFVLAMQYKSVQMVRQSMQIPESFKGETMRKLTTLIMLIAPQTAFVKEAARFLIN